jgi:hypothetical protein
MDVFERRKLMKNLAEGNFTQEDLDMLSREAPSESYGGVEHLAKEESDGRRIEADYRGETRAYWVPQDGAWISGKGITLEKAYRIFKEDDKGMEVGEVQDFSERDAIIRGYRAEISRILGK